LSPVSPEDFFILLRLDDGGNGVIVPFHLPFWRSAEIQTWIEWETNEKSPREFLASLGGFI